MPRKPKKPNKNQMHIVGVALPGKTVLKVDALAKKLSVREKSHVTRSEVVRRAVNTFVK